MQHIKYERAIKYMRRGSVLVETHIHLKTIWSVFPGGEVPGFVAQQLQNHDRVLPNEDGAWPGLSQTWRMENGQ
jgi:hypothetical protein